MQNSDYMQGLQHDDPGPFYMWFLSDLRWCVVLHKWSAVSVNLSAVNETLQDPNVWDFW